MSKLIETLNKHIALTPDQIVSKLTDPFGQWRQTNTLTEGEFEAHRQTRIVICSDHNRDNPTQRNVEMSHLIGADHTSPRNDRGYSFHRWDYHDYSRGILSENRWWFRSLASFLENEGEPF